MGGRVSLSLSDLEYMDGMNRDQLPGLVNVSTQHQNGPPERERESESRAIFPFNWMMTVRFFTLTAVSHYIFYAILTR